MKKKFTLVLTALLAVISLTMTSCIVDGTVGPMGPAGQDGWSDVKVIDFVIPLNSWQRDNSELNYWYYIYNTNLIDEYVVDNGAVLFYYGYFENSGYVNKWYSIPFTNLYFDEGLGYYYEKIYDASHAIGQVEIDIRDLNPTRFNYPDDRDVAIKIVILEGDHYNMLKKEGVNLKDFGELQRRVDLLSPNVTR